MFDSLTNRLHKIIEKIRSKGVFTEKNIKSIIRDVRISLLEADVSLSVVNEFINKIKDNIIGKKIDQSLTASQDFIKIIKNELTSLIGKERSSLNLSTKKPVTILIAGLQGSGKTTTAVKISKFLKNKKHKKVLLASTDIYRPAAMLQIKNLSKIAKIDFFDNSDQKISLIVKNAIEIAKNNFYDVLIIDTAGRLHINKKMMQEIKKIYNLSNPIETIFVADAMLGQEAANIAKHFNEIINITGIILTKVDGDSRGGAALSICHTTGKPIKFICNGEKIDDIEIFYPDRMSSRILGMGDFFSLIDDIENKIKIKNSQKTSNNIKNGNFDLNDFVDQIKQMQKMGGINNILQKLPIFNKYKNNILPMKEDFLTKMKSIISSMTKKERLNPEIIKNSHKKRIALGSGAKVQDINRLLKQFENMRYMIKKIKHGGIKKTISNLHSIIKNIR